VKARGIFILAKLYEVNSIFSAVSSLQKPPKFVPQVLKNVLSALVISKIHNMILTDIYSYSHNSLTSGTTRQLPVILLDSISCIKCGHSLITLEFSVIVNAYLLVQLTSMSKSPRAVCHATR